MNAFDTKDWRANPGTKHERQLLDQAREATLVFVIERISGYNGRVWVDGGGGSSGSWGVCGSMARACAA